MLLDSMDHLPAVVFNGRFDILAAIPSAAHSWRPCSTGSDG